jgi:hypothetical protein
MDEPTIPPKGKNTGRFYARPRRFFDVLQRDRTRVPISGWEIEDTRDGKNVSGIVLLEDPTEEQFLEAFEEQIGDPDAFIKAAGLLHEAIRSLARKPDSTRPELSLQSVIIDNAISNVMKKVGQVPAIATFILLQKKPFCLFKILDPLIHMPFVVVQFFRELRRRCEIGTGNFSITRNFQRVMIQARNDVLCGQEPIVSRFSVIANFVHR